MRALSVLLVMFMHATGYLRGPTGVTVFMVLSGFLITAILTEEWSNSARVDLMRFYWRRGVRLLPALLAVIGAVAVWMAASGQGGALTNVVLGPLLHYANWLAVDGEAMGMLGHAWSLSIEEQSYVTWPLLLLIALKVGGYRAAILAAGSLAMASVLIRFAFVAAEDTHRAFYGSDARADALLWGCLVALLLSSGARVSVRRWISMPAVIAVALLAVVPLDEAISIGFGEAVVGIGTAIGIAALVTMPFPHPILSLAPLVALGRISYGVYLVHFPIMTELGGAMQEWGMPALARAAILMPLSIAAAIVLWFIVERPTAQYKERVPRLRRRGVAAPERELQPAPSTTAESPA